MRRLVGVAGIGLLAAGCSSHSGPTSTPTTSVPPAPSVVLDCNGQAQTKPSEIIFYCADANVLANNISWTGWAPDVASGTGTLARNNCEPYCAAGTWEKTPVQLRLTSPAGDDHHFTAAVVTFPDGHVENFQLPPPLPRP